MHQETDLFLRSADSAVFGTTIQLRDDVQSLT